MHSEDLQKLGATVPNLVAIATWRPGFVHVCSKYTFKLNCMTELENSCVLLCHALSDDFKGTLILNLHGGQFDTR